MYNKDLWKQIREEIKVKLNWRFIVGKHFDKLWLWNCKYKMFKGAKGTKKSESIATYIIFRMIMEPMYNAGVLRRYIADHKHTTIPTFKTVLMRIQKLTGYEWEKYWDISSEKSNVHYIYYNRYGIGGNEKYQQTIRLFSWEDHTKMGSQKWTNGGFLGTLWWEEPLEQVNLDKKMSKGEDLTDEFMQEKWPTYEESLLRYDTILNGTEVKQDVIMSFNSWNKYHFIVQNYIYPYLQENEQILEEKGKQEYFSRDDFMGLGIYIMLMTWKVNEFRTRNEILMIFALRKNSYRDYRTIYLGLEYIFDGGVISDLMHLVIVNNEITTDYDEFRFGGDWSSKKDRSGMTHLKIKYKIVDGRRHIAKIKVENTKIFDRTTGHDTQRADYLLNWLNLIIETQHWEKMKIGRLNNPYAFLDSRDAFWIDYMNSNKKFYDFSKYISFTKAHKHDTHENAAGPLSRIYAIRSLIAHKLIEFDEESARQLKKESELMIWKSDFEKSDGNDDFFDMLGYGISNIIPIIAQTTG